MAGGGWASAAGRVVAARGAAKRAVTRGAVMRAVTRGAAKRAVARRAAKRDVTSGAARRDLTRGAVKRAATCRAAKRAAMLGDRGSVTAEFAIVLPAVLMVLVLSVGSIMIATQRLALTSAAAEMARHEARGDSASANAVLGGLGGPGDGQGDAASVARSGSGALHCVTLSMHPGSGLLSAISISGRGCAAVSEAAQ